MASKGLNLYPYIRPAKIPSVSGHLVKAGALDPGFFVAPFVLSPGQRYTRVSEVMILKRMANDECPSPSWFESG